MKNIGTYPRLANGDDNLDKYEDGKVKHWVMQHGRSDPDRLKYNTQNLPLEYLNLCHNKVSNDYITYAIQNYREHQMQSITDNGEIVISGVAYTYKLNLGENLSFDPFYTVPYMYDIPDRRYREQYCIDVTYYIIYLLRQFKRGFYISLICAPVSGTGVLPTFIENVRMNEGCDVILLHAVDDYATVNSYLKLGFIRITKCHDSLIFMYKKL